MNQINDKGLRHGDWEEFWCNGNLWYKGHYKNGRIQGYWEYYDFYGELIHQIFYA